jgi:hypothetical protein
MGKIIVSVIFYLKKFVQLNFLPHICKAMNKTVKNIQWWWQKNSSGVL